MDLAQVEVLWARARNAEGVGPSRLACYPSRSLWATLTLWMICGASPMLFLALGVMSLGAAGLGGGATARAEAGAMRWPPCWL